MTKLEPFKRQPQKMIKHTQTIHGLLSTNCLSVFDHYKGMALKGLIVTIFKIAFNLVRLHFKLLNEFQHQCYIGLKKYKTFSLCCTE